MVANVGDVIKISARKRAVYKVVEEKPSGALVIRRVHKHDFSDAGDKTSFILNPNQFNMIEEILGQSSVEDRPKAQSVFTKSNDSKTLSSMCKEDFVYRMKGEWNAILVLQDLASQYSPENLCCDGELSYSQVAYKKASLDRKWKAMEDFFGHSIKNDLT